MRKLLRNNIALILVLDALILTLAGYVACIPEKGHRDIDAYAANALMESTEETSESENESETETREIETTREETETPSETETEEITTEMESESEENIDSTESIETSKEETETESETEVTETESVVETTTAPIETVPETVAPVTTEETSAPSASVSDGLRVWIGDSRMVGLQQAVAYDPGKDVFIAQVGEALPWFQSTAVPTLESYLQAGGVGSVYINLGVNDCAGSYGNPSYNAAYDYASIINGLIDKYPHVRFYFMSVGIGRGDYYFSVHIPSMNNEVHAFNSIMQSSCRAVYIDTGEMIERDGFETADGIHYSASTYQRIYDYAKK